MPSRGIDIAGLVSCRVGRSHQPTRQAVTGISVNYSFDPGALALDDIRRLAADMWSDIAFDEAVLARLKRDGLTLDGVRLTGPSPFEIRASDNGPVTVSIASTVSDPAHAESLLDLWRVHMMKGLRPGSLAA
jgi:hypothetical protein